MKPRPNYMPPEQLAQVLAKIPDLHIRKWNDVDIQMLFKICYWCALRLNEAIRLTVDDFDFSINQLYLGKTKEYKGDSIPIPDVFVIELQLWLEGKQGELFPGLSYQTVYKWVFRLGKMLNIISWVTPQSVSGEKTKTHIFRKSIGKDMFYGEYDKKAPLTFISKTLRHKGKDPLATTIKYLKVDAEELNDWWKDVDVTQNR